ncbi:tetratricopeptide repeat protein [Hymenobacter koreensis]|uniref:Tetratricopeptide repeat protein n=1 Tax=Hymenobacter koreensis TaxID=1084523 RepID=A0ABP8ITP6_9BACT
MPAEPDLSRLQALFQTNRPDVAEQAVRQVLQQLPQDARLYALLALALHRQQQYAPASEAVRTSLALAPHYGYGHYIQAVILLAQGQAQAAVTSINESLRLTPMAAHALSLRALIHYELKQYAAGLADARAALAIDPLNGEALRWCVACLRRLNRFAEAKEAAQQWLQIEPNNAEAQLAVGHAALHFHEPTEAERHLVEAVRLNPTDQVARQQLSRAYQNRYLGLRLYRAYDAHYNQINTRVQRGQVWWFGLLLLEVILVGMLSPLILLWIGVDYLRWRLSPTVRRLRQLDAVAARQRRRSWALGLAFSAVLLSLVGAAVWVCSHFGWSLSWLGPGLVAGLTPLFYGLNEERQQLRP